MHEVVPCSVRIGSRNSKRFSTPRCECPAARYENERPCKHLIWLLDKISKQALFDHDPDSELNLTESGYPAELGDPFQRISEMRLDVLADSLHCDIAAPNCDTAPPNYGRVREAREMVAAVAGVRPRELDSYRPDLETSYNSASLIRRGDLEATLFSLILASHSLAAWVRTGLLDPSDPPVDPFRSLQRRVCRIIAELDAYSASLRDPALAVARREKGKEAEGPRNVKWAAEQIQNCVKQIEKSVSRRTRSPLAAWERSSAARALVAILKAIVNHHIDSHAGNTADDRNLYMRLVGNQHDFGGVYIAALTTLVDQSQFIEELEGIMDLLGRYGAPTSFAANMRDLITRMRSHTHAVGGSSTSTAAGRRESSDSMLGARSSTPSLDLPGPSQMKGKQVEFVPAQPEPSQQPRPEPPAPPAPAPAPTTNPRPARFLTPEVPASMSRRASGRGRRAGRGAGGGAGRAGGTAGGTSAGAEGSGSGSGAGSKRSVSGNGQDRGRGSKRAR
ncbi:hypothetical protein QBC46DRAFT_396171 [Diplogelasinospora grovesii]|uniref:SWIM-type domain-containing protein n=1 Tax=Diplogelasinospora grovesii TaxID=303347 RepID=A0AAN6MYP9_9PEZI|nr:hypothetical protein QBC46DRAFT_396171 [Diplogelasinospora grovesii]